MSRTGENVTDVDVWLSGLWSRRLARLADQCRSRIAAPEPVVTAVSQGSAGVVAQARADASSVECRKIWAMVRHEGHVVTRVPVLRLLCDGV